MWPLKPSVEWPFHLDILKARPDVGAIVHTHATYCTVLAIAQKTIPPVHYMIAAFGGNEPQITPQLEVFDLQHAVTSGDVPFADPADTRAKGAAKTTVEAPVNTSLLRAAVEATRP